MNLATAVILMATMVQAPHDSGHGHGHAHAPGHEEGRFGNPADLEAYIARQESPERAEWQKPDEVVKALALKKGQSVCEIGAGPGYFSLRLAKAVGDGGVVWALDVEPLVLGVLRERIEAAKARNLVPVLALPTDPLLPANSCDLVLMVNTFHHFDDGVAYLRRLERSLKRGGRIVNIDFYDRETPVGPPVDHRISREKFIERASAAGLEVVGEQTFLPYQYFLALAPR